jgi:hypothetical protein
MYHTSIFNEPLAFLLSILFRESKESRREEQQDNKDEDCFSSEPSADAFAPPPTIIQPYNPL